MSRSVWKGPFINVSFIKKINSTKSIVETRARELCVITSICW